MGKLFAFVILLGCIISACGAAPSPVAKAPDMTTTVKVWRDFELTLHADTDFDEAQRGSLVLAAESILRLTHGRARLHVIFDLDFGSVENLKAHASANDSMVIGVLSNYDIVAALDAALSGPGEVTAATTTTTTGAKVVFVIVDRVREGYFEEVATHELGHVIGFPDLHEHGAVMSGVMVNGVPPLGDWTAADVELCRQFEYCE